MNFIHKILGIYKKEGKPNRNSDEKINYQIFFYLLFLAFWPDNQFEKRILYDGSS